MCCCAIECLQCCLHFLNIIYMLTGVGLLIAGVVLLINGFVGSLSVLVPGMPYFYVAILLLIAAILIIATSFMGCMTTRKGDVCALIWYYVLVVIVICFEVSALVIAFTGSGSYHPEIEDYVITNVRLSMGKYGNPEETQFSSTWDDLQKRERCCGVVDHRDWYSYSTFDPGRPPDSCCVEFYEGCSKAMIGVEIWSKGCQSELLRATFSGLSVIGSFVIIFIIIQILLLIIVICLIYLLKFGSYQKNACCGIVAEPSYSECPGTEEKPRPANTNSSSWKFNPLYKQTGSDNGETEI